MILATIIICFSTDPCTLPHAYATVEIEGEFRSYAECQRAGMLSLAMNPPAAIGFATTLCGPKRPVIGKEA